MVVSMLQTNRSFFNVSNGSEEIIVWSKVSSVVYLCVMIGIQTKIYNMSDCSGHMTEKYTFPNLNIKLWKIKNKV